MNSTRTFTAAYPIFLDDAVIANAAHLITVTGYGDSIQFAVDGQPVSTLQAEGIRQLALSRGTFERLSGPSQQASQPITLTRRQAQALHLDLSRLGYTSVAHYEVASATVGREVASLTELSSSEAQAVWQHACLVRGYSTPDSRHYGAAAA